MRAIAHATYYNLAKKYKIPLKDKAGRAIPIKTLAKKIYDHEDKNKQIKKGLYFY